jgi:biofilm PGA synthesis N-glycosyltransferase PgaC
MNADGDTSFDNDMMINIIREFENPNVPAVGGALRVRNVKEGLATRMQSIEYMISLEGNKTGLGEWNLINNISGAFGAFRADFLRQIGGWDTHTAEDLDLTVRIKQYFKRHPNMRIPFAAHAIGHTDVPENFKKLMQQRLRWDGDLVFLYLRKHRKALTPSLLGFKTYIFTVMFGVLQNVLLPIIMMMFNIWAVYTYNAEVMVSILTIQYIYYFLLSAIHYVFFLILISERPWYDLKMSGWLLLYPFYTYFMRLFNCFAIINELVRRGHEESTMAPWWVLDRGNKF